MDKLVESLKELGFNTYESKVYISLLKKYPATAYEVSKLSNVPQSRTYDTLKVLTSKQIVTASVEKPIVYSPIKPTELTKRYKRRMSTNIEYLEKHLPEVKNNYVEPIIQLKGIDNITDKIKSVIQNAKKEIYLEIWAEDFDILEKYLLNAYNRNVDIRIVGYNKLQSRFGLVYEHPYPKKIENYVNGRLVSITVDDKEGIFGKTYSDNEDDITAIYTQNKDMAFLFKEIIVHDMFILDIQQNLPEELTYVYGKGLRRLYDRVLGLNNIYK